MSTAQWGQYDIEYSDTGDGEPVVVLVHGWSYSGQVWRALQAELAERGVRSIAISLLGAGGSGRSAHEGDYHPESYAKQVEAVVQAAGVESFVLMGHSLGTITAAYYARDYGSRLLALVQMSGPPVISQVPDQTAGRVGATDPTATVFDDLWEKQHAALPADVRAQLKQDIENNPSERPLGQRPPWTSIDDVAETMSIPTLVICGDADDVVNPRFPVQYYLSLPKEVRHLHVFHGIGHYPNAHIPDRLAGVLSRFLTEHAGGAS